MQHEAKEKFGKEAVANPKVHATKSITKDTVFGMPSSGSTVTHEGGVGGVAGGGGAGSGMDEEEAAAAAEKQRKKREKAKAEAKAPGLDTRGICFEFQVRGTRTALQWQWQ